MDLKRNGFLYGFAYAWAIKPPMLQTNIWRLFGRLVLSLFIGWPIVVPLVFIFGAKLPTRDGLRVWSLWGNFFGKEVIPPQIAALAALALTAVYGMIYWALLPFGVTHLPKGPGSSDILALAIVLGFVGWVLALIISFVWLWIRIDERIDRLITLGKILRGYLKAKKAKVCPIIRIV